MPALKRRTNVTLDPGLLDAARDLGLNVSAIAEAALGTAFDDVGAAPPVVRGRHPVALEGGELGQIVERLAHIEVLGTQRRLENAEAALE